MNRIFPDSDDELTPAVEATGNSVISPVPPTKPSENPVADTLNRGEKRPIVEAEEPTSMAESVRRSGLAYSAAIAFFASVVFMLVIGWGADLLLGSSPWGIVVGIVFGSIIGFVQFFRINSQIFVKEPKVKSDRILISDDDDGK